MCSIDTTAGADKNQEFLAICQTRGNARVATPNRIYQQRLTKAALLSIALFTAGCAKPSDSRTPPIQPIYDKTTGQLQLLVIKRDVDGDGKIDRWDYYGPDRKFRKFGFSLQNDGQEDAWAYVGPDGATMRIESSPRRNGRIQRIEHFEHDVLARAEDDTDGDGKIDKWETYDGPRLATVAFDTTHRGRPDRRFVYGADGSVRVEVDPRGDGHFVDADARP